MSALSDKRKLIRDATRVISNGPFCGQLRDFADSADSDDIDAFIGALRRTPALETVARIINPNCFWDEPPPNDHQQRKCDRALSKAAAIVALYGVLQS